MWHKPYSSATQGEIYDSMVRQYDYSPYFDIIKYLFLGVDDVAIYRQSPWYTGTSCETPRGIALLLN